MIGKFEFDLSDVEERGLFEDCLKAQDYRCALWNIMYKVFRTRIKYTEMSEESEKIIQEMNEEAWGEVGDLLDE